ncbi:hypothetical protein [Priestia aryabhattai]|uniref:hypothetical protein n=1 Tax=Priestia aryabhattai TaxID=412384 RepID=UPI000BF15C1D|nr:hypothetical protein [Priestia aryabhattai]PEI54999.1 hypothetical protein CN635_18820 [Priestia aryabhattai]
MRVNNSGNLSVTYFRAYFHLVMNTQGMNYKEAQSLIFQRLFHQDPTLRGETTYSNFKKAAESFEL